MLYCVYSISSVAKQGTSKKAQRIGCCNTEKKESKEVFIFGFEKKAWSSLFFSHTVFFLRQWTHRSPPSSFADRERLSSNTNRGRKSPYRRRCTRRPSYFPKGKCGQLRLLGLPRSCAQRLPGRAKCRAKALSGIELCDFGFRRHSFRPCDRI